MQYNTCSTSSFATIQLLSAVNKEQGQHSMRIYSCSVCGAAVVSCSTGQSVLDRWLPPLQNEPDITTYI